MIVFIKKYTKIVDQHVDDDSSMFWSLDCLLKDRIDFCVDNIYFLPLIPETKHANFYLVIVRI